MSRMKKLIPLLDKVDTRFVGETLNIVELGTIRNAAEPYRDGDGWSTYHIAQWIQGKPHRFFSVDLSIKVAAKFLLDRGMLAFVDLHESHSHNWLRGQACPDVIHFALLDTANDADNTYREWELLANKLPIGGIVVVDDVDLNSNELKKGDRLIPLLQADDKYSVKLSGRLAIIEKWR